jgi:hypothetical protein
LSHQDQSGRDEVIRAILQYLVEHLDAKDTVEGVSKWWLADSHRWGRRDVQVALDLLTLKGWLTKREAVPANEFYGINKDRLQEIRSFLQQSGAGS